MSIRVLYLDHTAKASGGEIALHNLITHLDRNQVEPVVALAERGPLVEWLQEAGIEVYVLPLEAGVARISKDGVRFTTALQPGVAWALGRYVRSLSRFMRDQRIDLVHTNSLKADIYGGLAARLAGVPVVWHVRDHIDDNYLPHQTASAFRWLARWLPTVIICNSHSTRSALAGDAAAFHTTVVYSRVVTAKDNSTGSPRMTRWQVVYDGTQVGVKTDKYQASSPDLAETGAKIGLVGRIAPWKGQHIFVQATSRVCAAEPSAAFFVIGSALFGEDEYEREVRALVSRLGLEGRVQFLGFRNDVPALLEQLDVVVHASTAAEPFGQVIIEAMNAGKPVVATNLGGPSEIVVDCGIRIADCGTAGTGGGETDTRGTEDGSPTGILVPPGDSVAMAEAITWLLNHPEEARAMGQAGRRRVKKHFDIQQTTCKVEAIYEMILSRRKRRVPGSLVCER